MSTVTQEPSRQSNYGSYPVTPPENWALEQFEFWDMLFLKREKLYKRFWGEQRQHTQQRTTTTTTVVSNRAPLNYGCGFVWFLYTKTDQVNVSMYIAECKGCSFDTPDLVQSP